MLVETYLEADVDADSDVRSLRLQSHPVCGLNLSVLKRSVPKTLAFAFLGGRFGYFIFFLLGGGEGGVLGDRAGGGGGY